MSSPQEQFYVDISIIIDVETTASISVFFTYDNDENNDGRPTVRLVIRDENVPQRNTDGRATNLIFSSSLGLQRNRIDHPLPYRSIIRAPLSLAISTQGTSYQTNDNDDDDDDANISNVNLNAMNNANNNNDNHDGNQLQGQAQSLPVFSVTARSPQHYPQHRQQEQQQEEAEVEYVTNEIASQQLTSSATEDDDDLADDLEILYGFTSSLPFSSQED